MLSSFDPQLSPVKVQAVGLLVAGRTFSQVATELNVDRSTVFRWRRETAFAEELRRRLAETLDVVAARTRAAVLRSSELVAETLNHSDRHGWAFKLLTNKRVWEMAQTLPTIPPEAEADEPPAVDRRVEESPATQQISGDSLLDGEATAAEAGQ